MTKTAIVIGTGPSLNVEEVREAGKRDHVMLFGMNNVYQDFDLDVWLACDPAWHYHNGKVEGDFDKWHWDKGICTRFGYRYIEGRWHDGVSPVGADWISFNHGSGPQVLNLATSIYQCIDKVLLVGHDMTYRQGEKRHYFSGLSNCDGEYPEPLRKYSLFEKPKRVGGLN